MHLCTHESHVTHLCTSAGLGCGILWANQNPSEPPCPTSPLPATATALPGHQHHHQRPRRYTPQSLQVCVQDTPSYGRYRYQTEGAESECIKCTFSINLLAVVIVYCYFAWLVNFCGQNNQTNKQQTIMIY